MTPRRRVTLSVRATPARHLVAQEAVVDEDAVEAVAQHPVHQRRRDGAVHAAGQRADDVLLGTHLRSEQMRSIGGRGSSNFVHSRHCRMTVQTYAWSDPEPAQWHDLPVRRESDYHSRSLRSGPSAVRMSIGTSCLIS